MVARSEDMGHRIVYDPYLGGGQWVYEDNGQPVAFDRACLNCHQIVNGKKYHIGAVPVPILMSDGDYKERMIDPCIAFLVNELNAHGIRTVAASCCGHGTKDGYIFIDPACVEEHEFGLKLKIWRAKE